ncbi:MAG: hypothetical protein ACXVNQ_04185 [Bacteroidia bacterium]
MHGLGNLYLFDLYSITGNKKEPMQIVHDQVLFSLKAKCGLRVLKQKKKKGKRRMNGITNQSINQSFQRGENM